MVAESRRYCTVDAREGAGDELRSAGISEGREPVEAQESLPPSPSQQVVKYALPRLGLVSRLTVG